MFHQKSMRNILYIIPIGQVGGAEVNLLDLLKNLDRNMFLLIVFCPSDGPLPERLRRRKIMSYSISGNHFCGSIISYRFAQL